MTAGQQQSQWNLLDVFQFRTLGIAAVSNHRGFFVLSAEFEPMPCKVVHCKRDSYDVYIGRANPRGGLKASPWANPFVIGKHGDRDEVLARYEDWIRRQPQLMTRLLELDGKTLGCWCVPERCHGDILSRLVDEVKSSA